MSKAKREQDRAKKAAKKAIRRLGRKVRSIKMIRRIQLLNLVVVVIRPSYGKDVMDKAEDLNFILFDRSGSVMPRFFIDAIVFYVIPKELFVKRRRGISRVLEISHIRSK